MLKNTHSFHKIDQASQGRIIAQIESQNLGNKQKAIQTTEYTAIKKKNS